MLLKVVLNTNKNTSHAAPAKHSKVGVPVVRVCSDESCQSMSCEFVQHYFRRLTKSQCDKSHSSAINGLTFFVEKQPVALKDFDVENWS